MDFPVRVQGQISIETEVMNYKQMDEAEGSRVGELKKSVENSVQKTWQNE